MITKLLSKLFSRKQKDYPVGELPPEIEAIFTSHEIPTLAQVRKVKDFMMRDAHAWVVNDKRYYQWLQWNKAIIISYSDKL